MPFRIGPTELIVILVIIIIVFGVGKLPQVGGALGKGIKEFRKGQKEIDEIPKALDSTTQNQESEMKS